MEFATVLLARGCPLICHYHMYVLVWFDLVVTDGISLAGEPR